MPGPSDRFSHLPKVFFRALMLVVPAVLLVAAALLVRGHKSSAVGFAPQADSAPTEWQESPVQTTVAVASRPVFPYSIVAGGVRDKQELQAAAASDALVARHYSDFRIAQARTIRLDHPVAMYVSYRRNEQVYWTKNRMVIPAGETLITDGENLARVRCANRLSPVAVKPIAAFDPTTEELDQPSFLPPLMAGLLPGGETGFVPGSAAGPVGPSGPPTGGSVTPPVLPPIYFPGGPPISPNTPVTPPPPVSTAEPGALALLLTGIATTLLFGLAARRR